MAGCPFPGPTGHVGGMGGTPRTNILNSAEPTLILSGTLTIEWLGELNSLSLAMAGTTGEQERARFATICDSYGRQHQKTCSTSNSTTELSFSNGGITSCFQRCRSPEPYRIVRDLNSSVGWGIGRAALTWGLSPIGWSGNIGKRLPAEYLSLSLMLSKTSTPAFLTIFSSSRTRFGA